MILLVLAAVFAALYVVFRLRDTRLLRNGVFLVAAIVLGFGGSVLVLEPFVPGGVAIIDTLIAIALLAIPVLGVALIANGVTMLRSEGRSLGNTLSLIVGIAVILVPAVGVAVYSRFSAVPVVVGASAFVVLVVLYVGGAFSAFLAYSIVYGHVQRRAQHPATIVVLGSGLIRGEVPPLLRSRLDKAISIYRRPKPGSESGSESGHRMPLVIPSGGQGSDESRPEGVAMAEYLVAHGVAADDVRAETASRNTRENLLLSRVVQEEAGRTGTTLVVTNNYHVLRTALLARSIGSDAQVVGSRTAFYYVPSAFLREFIAVMVEHKWFNLVAVLSFAALVGAAFWESFQQ